MPSAPTLPEVTTLAEVRSELSALPVDKRAAFILGAYERYQHIPVIRAEIEKPRQVTVRSANFDDANLTFELSFASETPVERWFGTEILECTKDAADLSRMNDGAPLLIGHNPDNWPGTVERAWVDNDKTCRALVRCADDEEGKRIYRRVKTGIMRKVSVGYRINDLVLSEQKSDGLDTYRATRWTSHEASLVSIPADNSVGVGRSKETTSTTQSRTKMPDPVIEPTAPAVAPVITTQPRIAAPVADNNRMTEIIALGKGFNVPQERVNKALVENETSVDFAQACLRDHAKAPLAAPPTIGMSRAEKRRYSLVRAINKISNREALDGLEREASDAAAKLYKREPSPGGFLMPHDISVSGDREMLSAMLRVSPSLAFTPYGKELQRGLLANNFTGAGALIAEDFLGGSFIELLRNRALLTSLGVGTLSGLTGNVAIPRQSSASTAYWLDEAGLVTASQQGFAQVLATPKRLACQTAYNKQLLAQSTLDVEALVRDDHVRVIALAKDLAGIQGTGGVQPRGILLGPTTDGTGGGNNITSINIPGAMTRTNLLSFMSAIQTANADIGTMQWLVNPNTRAKWQSLVQVANYPVYLTNDAGQTIGYPTPFTNQIGTSGTFANRAIFGAWGQAMFCDWAGYDIVVDPYTRAGYNEIVVTVNLMTDFIVRHWPSFAISDNSAAQ